jgi:hypothetical protein
MASLLTRREACALALVQRAGRGVLVLPGRAFFGGIGVRMTVVGAFRDRGARDGCCTNSQRCECKQRGHDFASSTHGFLPEALIAIHPEHLWWIQPYVRGSTHCCALLNDTERPANTRHQRASGQRLEPWAAGRYWLETGTAFSVRVDRAHEVHVLLRHRQLAVVRDAGLRRHLDVDFGNAKAVVGSLEHLRVEASVGLHYCVATLVLPLGHDLGPRLDHRTERLAAQVAGAEAHMWITLQAPDLRDMGLGTEVELALVG